MSYNKEIDYQAQIDEALERGDYVSAAKSEQSRNEKIDGEGLDYEKTNRFSGWLDPTDYSTIIKKQISSGAPKSDVSQTLKQRVTKASSTEGLEKYAYDDVYDEAIRYLMDYGKPEFKNSYGKTTENLLKSITEVKPFSYNPYEDELYEYYRQQYLREGNLAMEDILGEVASATGGVASSYAVSAAAQARESYNRKLTDKIPELYEQAYERYLDDIELDENSLELLLKLTEGEHQRYLGELEQYNTDRELEYMKEKDKRKEESEAKKEEADLMREEAALQREEEETRRKEEYERSQDEYEREQQQIENALEIWKYLGYLDPASAEILGLQPGLHTSDYDYKKAQQYRLYHK